MLLNGSEGAYLDLTRDQSNASLRLFYDDTGQRTDTHLPNPNFRIAAFEDLVFAVNTNKPILRFSDQGRLGVLTSEMKNTLDINGNLSIGYEQEVPSNSLAINRRVSVGFDQETMPLHQLEVSGSVVVGEPTSTELTKGMFINSDGTAKLLVGVAQTRGRAQVAANGDLTINNGPGFITKW